MMEIEGRSDRDQERRAAKIERRSRISDQEFGHKAHHHRIAGVDCRGPRRHPVDAAGGVINAPADTPDARQWSTTGDARL
jgi:hypothetical protein